ncbi:MAG: hypothetical protein E6J69_17315 [Deltaproteobacteria bacterium]|nr:MAG: hypothetical protein E6J69_17315 [Deltaproteobacteria bacterium]
MTKFRVLLFAGSLSAASAGATTVADCQRVVAQFEAHVGRLALAGRDQPDVQRKLAEAAAPRASMAERLQKLRELSERAGALEAQGKVSRFDADRLARGAEAAMLCLQRVREGR